MIGVDNFCTGFPENIAHLRSESGFEFVEQDICLSFDPGPVDYVFNFAFASEPFRLSKVGY